MKKQIKPIWVLALTKSTAWEVCLPSTATSTVAESTPRKFLASHLYEPRSLNWTLEKVISPFSLLKCLLFILWLSLYQVISGLGKPTDWQEKDTLLPSFAVKLVGGFLVILGTSKWIKDQQNLVRKTEREYLSSLFNIFEALFHRTLLIN